MDAAYLGLALVLWLLMAGMARGCMNGERLFGLVMIELWRREYRVDVG